MRTSSLRAFLIVVALVVQTLASGLGASSGKSWAAPSGVSAHCTKLMAAVGGAGKTHSDENGGACDHCCLCADESCAAAICEVRPALSAPGSRRGAVARPRGLASVAAVASQSHFARGPPLAVNA